VTVNEEHKTEEQHEVSSPVVVNGSDEIEDVEQTTAAAAAEQAASSEAGPSIDHTETTDDEAKPKEKGAKAKGFMGFLKSKTRSQSKEREQAADKEKGAHKSKSESEEDDGSKKGDSLERGEQKPCKIGLFSKKTEGKKPEEDETQHPSADGDKDAEKHKASKFSLFGKKKDKPSDDADEHKGESKEEPASEATENVEDIQSKPKEKKWFHFGKKSSKDTCAIVGDAHPYEEPTEDAKKDNEEDVKEKEVQLEPEKQEAEKLDQEEKTAEEQTTANDASESQEAADGDNPSAAVADADTGTGTIDEKQTEDTLESHTEEKSSDVSPGGTLTSETDSKDSKVHKKFSFGIKFGKKQQKVSKSESSEDTKANKDNVNAEDDTAKQEQSNEQAKDDDGTKHKKHKLFSFGRLTKSKSKDEPEVKCSEKQTEDAERQEDKSDIPEAAATATTADSQIAESDEQHEADEQKQTDEAAEPGETPSEKAKPETETDAVVEMTETDHEVGRETAEEEKKEDEITAPEVPAKDEVNEPEVKRDKKEPKKFSFGIKFGHKKDEKAEGETSEDVAHNKQKETKWSPFSKKPVAKKASDEPVKIEEGEDNKREDNDEAAKTVAATSRTVAASENTGAGDVATESTKAEEISETKEEKTVHIRLPKLFSFGKKEALAEDRNIAQESKDVCADGVDGDAEADTEKHGEEEHAEKQVDGDKKEGSKMSAGIRKLFSMGRKEKEGETKQEEAATCEENKEEETGNTDAERRTSSPESKHRQRSKSPHKKFPFDIKFGKKKEKSETDLKEKEEAQGGVETAEDEGKDSQLQQPEAAASSDVPPDSAAATAEQPEKKDTTEESREIASTSGTVVVVAERTEVKASTSSQLESAPPAQEASSEPAAPVAAAASKATDSQTGEETANKPDEDNDKDKPASETQSIPVSDSDKPAAATRARRFPFGFKFIRRSERAKSADRTTPAATGESTGGAPPSQARTETVKKTMETSASVPDVHLHATSYEDNQAPQEQDETAVAAETEEIPAATKTKDSHLHIGIKWPHFGGGKKSQQKPDDQKEKEKETAAVDGGNESVGSRPSADDAQPSADEKDSSTPKSKKSLLGKGIFRLFSPRRDLQKSQTMDGERVISYSVEGEGQIMAADTDCRSKTASLDSKGRMPKSLTTGADRSSEMVEVVAADTSADLDRCDGEGTAAVGGHLVVVAIDFGTTYSGYAFSFARDARSAATQIHMMRRWEGGDPGVVNQKTPTTILLTPAKQFHSFGFTARDFYHDLDQAEAGRWLYFEKFKMNLHHCTVRDRTASFHFRSCVLNF